MSLLPVTKKNRLLANMKFVLSAPTIPLSFLTYSLNIFIWLCKAMTDFWMKKNKNKNRERERERERDRERERERGEIGKLEVYR